MRLVLFTKDHDIYSPFIKECSDKFDHVLIVTSDRSTSEIQGIRCIFHNFKNSEKYSLLVQQVNDFNADLLISFCYNRIIHQDILDIIPLCVNFHGSLLPNYAGAHALNWQIINGETKSGMTIHQLSKEVDGGKIIMQHEFEILKNDDVNDVLHKLISSSCILLKDFMDKFKDNNLSFITQERTGNEFICRKRTPEDGLLTSKMSPHQVYNMCRGLAYPWPGAFYVNPQTEEKVSIATKIELKKADSIVKILRG